MVMGGLVLPRVAAETLPAAATARTRITVQAFDNAARFDLPFDMDTWDGYPAARQRLYQAALAAKAELLVLSGDSHNAWAFDRCAGRPADRGGIRGSRGDLSRGGGLSAVGEAGAAGPGLAQAQSALAWCDTAQRGYLALELTPKAATGEWRFMAQSAKGHCAGRHQANDRASGRAAIYLILNWFR